MPEDVDPIHSLVEELKSNPRRASREVFTLEEQKAIADSWYQLRANLAVNACLLPEVQAVLALDSDWEVRNRVAQNPSLTPEMQEALSRSSDSDVRGYVAKNPAVDARIIQRLMKDPVQIVRWCVTQNPDFEWSSDLPAVFVDDLNPDYFDLIIKDCDEEIVDSLLQSWEGTLAELVVAAGLVNR